MVRTAKKLIAVMLAAVLLMSMCVTAAYADELRAGTVARGRTAGKTGGTG